MTRRRFPLGRVSAVLAPIALFVALLSWAFASPLGASPDDQYHMPSIWCGQGLRDGLCEAGATPQAREVPKSLSYSSVCFAFDGDQSASCTEPVSTALVETKEGNFVGDYPPVYYMTMSLFASTHIEVSVLAMRALNAALFVGVMFALFLLLPKRRRGAFVWGGLAAIVPLGMFLISSVNPSSWAILSAFALWHALVGYFEATDRRRRIAFGAIATLTTVMGSGARSDSAVYSGIAVVVACVLTAQRTRSWAKLAILPAAFVVVAAVFFLAAGQSSIVDPGATGGTTSLGSALALTAADLALLPQLWTGALGSVGLGWLDTTMPGIVWVSVVSVFVGFVFWGIQYLDRRKSIALSLVFGALVVIPMYVLVKDGLMVGAGVQPRYVYPLLIMFVSIALFRKNGDGPGLKRVHYYIAAISVGVANAVALHVNLRRYVTGLDVNGVNLDAGKEWWWNVPFGAMTVWAVGVVSFGFVILLAVARFLPETTTARRGGLDGPMPSLDSLSTEPRGNGDTTPVG